MTDRRRIGIIDYHPENIKALTSILDKLGCEVSSAVNEKDIEGLLKKDFDVVVYHIHFNLHPGRGSPKDFIEKGAYVIGTGITPKDNLPKEFLDRFSEYIGIHHLVDRILEYLGREDIISSSYKLYKKRNAQKSIK